jgi:hypothetical protein
MTMICGIASKSSMNCCARKTDRDDQQAASQKKTAGDDAKADAEVRLAIFAQIDSRRSSRSVDWSRVHPPGPDLSETTHLRI